MAVAYPFWSYDKGCDTFFLLQFYSTILKSVPNIGIRTHANSKWILRLCSITIIVIIIIWIIIIIIIIIIIMIILIIITIIIMKLVNFMIFLKIIEIFISQIFSCNYFQRYIFPIEYCKFYFSKTGDHIF